MIEDRKELAQKWHKKCYEVDFIQSYTFHNIQLELNVNSSILKMKIKKLLENNKLERHKEFPYSSFSPPLDYAMLSVQSLFIF